MNDSCPYDFDPDYDLVRGISGTAGYHSQLPAGTQVHPTRDSAYAATWFLSTGSAENEAIALRILGKLLSLQISDPTDPHFGIWGWFAEEPPAQMAPADWNWADFIGAALLELLAQFESRLDSGRVTKIDEALERACWSIFRRNVGPGYTNICAMGAFVCMAYGERSGNALLTEYGVRRFRAFRLKTEQDGAFSEYNSPTYSMVLLEEIERVLRMVKHEGAREDARWMQDLSWKLISSHYHPGTHQWAGAQSRSYSNWTSIQGLANRLSYSLLVRKQDGALKLMEPKAGIHPVLPCPQQYLSRFLRLPEHENVQTEQVWIRNETGQPVQTGTTWFSQEATLGSIDKETTWVQRRILVVYWKTELDPAVRLRARLLHNGKDFESGFIRSNQSGPRVLSGFHFIKDGGEWHPHFDIPADGTFRTLDLRVRYEAEGKGLELNELGKGRYEFRAGNYRAVLHTGAIRFDGKNVTHWQPGTNGDLVWVEGIFYAGSAHPFNPGKLGECTAIAGLELLCDEDAAGEAAMSDEEKDGRRYVLWPLHHALNLSLPLQSPGKKEAYNS